jgi:putative membrane protein
MKSLWGASLLAAALAVGGCNNQKAADGAVPDQTADTMGTVPSEGTMAPADGMTDGTAPPNAVDVPTYVQTAASSDLFEIRSSQLALKQSQDKQVRDFAQRMIADHQTSTAGLKQAVSEGAQGTPIPTEMMPRHAQMLRELEQAGSGSDRAAFDRLYLNQQRTAHSEALNLHRSIATRGDVPEPLKTFAARTADAVDGHYKMLMAAPAEGGMATKGSTGATGASGTGAAATPPGAEGAAAASASGRVTGAENRATGNSG